MPSKYGFENKEDRREQWEKAHPKKAASEKRFLELDEKVSDILTDFLNSYEGGGQVISSGDTTRTPNVHWRAGRVSVTLRKAREADEFLRINVEDGNRLVTDEAKDLLAAVLQRETGVRSVVDE